MQQPVIDVDRPQIQGPGPIDHLLHASEARGTSGFQGSSPIFGSRTSLALRHHECPSLIIHLHGTARTAAPLIPLAPPLAGTLGSPMAGRALRAVDPTEPGESEQPQRRTATVPRCPRFGDPPRSEKGSGWVAAIDRAY